MDAQHGTTPKDKILLILDEETVDITAYYEGGALIEQVKESAPDQITSGDMRLTFINSADTFTEMSPTSELYQRAYHNRKVQFYSGFELPDGSSEFILQATMDITEMEFISDDSRVILTLQDRGRRLLDFVLNRKPGTMVPTMGTANTGNGGITSVGIKAFSTVAETWTLTCTLAGGAGVATFSVVGSVSGNIGTATDGTQFSTGNKVRFTIFAGSTNWALNDTITFSTVLNMQFSAVNPIKIIWAILTGYNWDTGAQESWYDRTPQYSNLKVTGNPDIDYEAFSRAVADAQFTLTGYIDWDKMLTEALQDIVLHFLGSLFINEHGQVSVEWFVPHFGGDVTRTFSDAKKISGFRYFRNIRDVINRVRVAFKRRDTWDWDDNDFTYDGVYIAEDSTSIGQYGLIGENYTSRWYSANGAHVEYFADRVVDRFSTPPVRARFDTGLDALTTRLGHRVYITDTKASMTQELAEVVQFRKDFSTAPRNIQVDAIFEPDVAWGFLGSSSSENDGISPQASHYDDADADDRRFAYLSHEDDFSYMYETLVMPTSLSPTWRNVTSITTATVISNAISAGVLVMDAENLPLGDQIGYVDDLDASALSKWAAYASPSNGRAKLTVYMRISKIPTAAVGTASIRIVFSPTATSNASIIDFYSDRIEVGGIANVDTPTDGEFHNYAIEAANPTLLRFYIDGVLQASGTGSAPHGQSRVGVTVQGYGAGGGNAKAEVGEVYYVTSQPYELKPDYRMF